MSPTSVDQAESSRDGLSVLRWAGSHPIVRSFPQGAIIVFDAHLRYLCAGGLGLADVGLSREMLEGNTIDAVFPPEVVAFIEPLYRQALAGCESAMDVPYQGRIYLMRLGPLRDAAGAIVAGMGFTQDVTASRESERNLLEERRRLREAELIGRVGSWELYIEPPTVTCSAGMFRLYGMDPATFDGTYRSATRQVHPDDLQAVNDSVAACAASGAPIHLQYRVIRADDDAVRWLDARGEAKYEDGRVERIGGTVVDVTDQVMGQADELAAKSFQQAVFSASPDVISVWDIASRSILWTNRSIPEMLGYTEQDVQGMGGDIGSVVEAEDRVRYEAALASARDAANDDVVEVDYRMRHRDGTTRWFSQRTAPLTRDQDGRVTQIVGVVRDTTDSLAAAAALRTKDELLDQLADSVDVAFLLRSLDPPAFLYVSPAYEKIFGYNPMVTHQTPDEALLGIHPDDRERFLAEYWAPSLAGKAATSDYRVFRADGEVRWVRSKTKPVGNREDNLGRSASTVEDITASRSAEAALRAAAEAQKANAAKNEFLSRMSHELRTPLNAVLGFAQILELDTAPGEQHEAVEHILRGGRHLLGLIDDVLDISKIEGDRMDMSLELVPISELVTETVQLMTPQADAAGVRLRFVPSAPAARPVEADHRRLRQVLLNLLSNAIKYNRPGGRVEVSCAAAGPTMLAITVGDTGRGIRAEDLPRLFTPFDRLDAAATGIDGTGVGLALSHRLMTLMGGTLTATSEAGAGSVFTACIPFATAQWAEPTAAVAGLSSSTQLAPSTAVGKTRTLLYVEDNSSNIRLMEQLVTRRPHWQLVVAGHGALGLELAASTAPDLILLDLHLPDMRGIDILHMLGSGPATKDLKVVIVSADANPHQMSRVLAAGARAYLTKPLDVAKVLELLDTPDDGPAGSAR